MSNSRLKTLLHDVGVLAAETGEMKYIMTGNAIMRLLDEFMAFSMEYAQQKMLPHKKDNIETLYGRALYGPNHPGSIERNGLSVQIPLYTHLYFLYRYIPLSIPDRPALKPRPPPSASDHNLHRRNQLSDRL